VKERRGQDEKLWNGSVKRRLRHPVKDQSWISIEAIAADEADKADYSESSLIKA
jgi:hypothetical protein